MISPLPARLDPTAGRDWTHGTPAQIWTKLHVATLDGCCQHAPQALPEVAAILRDLAIGHFETVNPFQLDRGSLGRSQTRRPRFRFHVVDHQIGHCGVPHLDHGQRVSPTGPHNVAQTFPESLIVCLSKCGRQFRSDNSQVRVRSCKGTMEQQEAR